MSQTKKVNKNSQTYKYFQKLKKGICPNCMEGPPEHLEGELYEYVCNGCHNTYDYGMIEDYFNEIGEEWNN